MGLVTFICGCSIGTSMFGDRPLTCVVPCLAHSALVQDELKALRDALLDGAHKTMPLGSFTVSTTEASDE